jgi:CheY-like chemotaxis protein
MGCKEVVLIDDDASLREVFHQLISRRGYDVITFEHAQAALPYLSSHWEDVGLVFLDLDMPVLDGFAFLDVRRSDPTLLAIPVVVLAAFPANTNLQPSDVVATLAKPAVADTILDLVLRYCGRPVTPTSPVNRPKR